MLRACNSHFRQAWVCPAASAKAASPSGYAIWRTILISTAFRSAKKAGLHCGFGFPIPLGEKAIGAMVFFGSDVREPDQDVLQMMANVGSQIGQFIERRRAEEELRRSEAYLAEAQRLSLTGSFGWNASTGELFWSKETFYILGYDLAMKPTLELVLQRVHPEDFTLVQEIFDRASRDRADLDFEHRLVLPDDSVKHVHVVAHAAKDGSGGLEFVGAVSDVTITKVAQERIRQNEKEFRQIVDRHPSTHCCLGSGWECPLCQSDVARIHRPPKRSVPHNRLSQACLSSGRC